MSKRNKGIYGHTLILKLVQIAGYDSTLHDAAKRTLMIFAGYANNKDYSAFPSISKVAKATGRSRAAITKQLNILQKHGYIEKRPNYHPENGSRKTNIYIFNFGLAKQYQTIPDIFCARNVTLIAAWYATILSCKGMHPVSLPCLVTATSCINKYFKETINKK